MNVISVQENKKFLVSILVYPFYSLRQSPIESATCFDIFRISISIMHRTFDLDIRIIRKIVFEAIAETEFWTNIDVADKSCGLVARIPHDFGQRDSRSI